MKTLLFTIMLLTASALNAQSFVDNITINFGLSVHNAPETIITQNLFFDTANKRVVVLGYDTITTRSNELLGNIAFGYEYANFFIEASANIRISFSLSSSTINAGYNINITDHFKVSPFIGYDYIKPGGGIRAQWGDIAAFVTMYGQNKTLGICLRGFLTQQ
jgi:hypothetical protein